MVLFQRDCMDIHETINLPLVSCCIVSSFSMLNYFKRLDVEVTRRAVSFD